MGIFTGKPINTTKLVHLNVEEEVQDALGIKSPSELEEEIQNYCAADFTATLEAFHTQDKATKENNFHKKKLLELCEGYSEDEVRIACRVFARRFPNAMYDSLRDEHQNMVSMVTGVQQLQTSYLEKMGVL